MIQLTSKISKKLKQTMKRFAGNQSGNVAVIFGLSAVPLIMVGGMALDYNRGVTAKTQAQKAVDAGALTAALATGETITVNSHDEQDGETTDFSNDSAKKYLAKKIVLSNLPEHLRRVAEEPSVVINQDGSANVSVRFDLGTSFTTVVGIKSMAISAKATASVLPDAKACIMALGPNGSGITLTGNSDVSMSGCQLYSNKTGSQSLTVGGSSSVVADKLCAVGSSSLSGSGTSSVAPSSGCAPLDDPLANWTPPVAAGSCSNSNYSDSGKGKNKKRTYHAGTHCNIDPSGSIKHVEFDAGIHHVTGNKFDLSGGLRSVTGSNIGIYLASSVNDFDINAQTAVDLSASTTGAMAGLIIAQDPAASVYSITFNGGSSMDLNGTVYLPSANMSLKGNNSSSLSPVTQFITNSFTMTGNSDIEFNADFASAGFPELGGSVVGVVFLSE